MASRSEPPWPLEPDPELLRQWADACVDFALEHLASLAEQASWDLDDAAALAATFDESVPHQGKPLAAILERLRPAIAKSLNTAGPGYLAFIPGGGVPSAALADLIACAVNRYVGVTMAAPALARIEGGDRPLAGRRVIVTSGPTREPIDPVRYIANRSSGKQGHAIAAAAVAAGAQVTLVSGPVSVPDPVGARIVRVETARDMLAAVKQALPADAAVFAAAVADWRVDKPSASKIKKRAGGSPRLELMENPDILAAVARETRSRPQLVVGFAAETDHVIARAKAKLARKGCDWIVANDVSAGTGVMGGDRNTVHLVTAHGVESWPPQSKDGVARALVRRIAEALAGAGQ